MNSRISRMYSQRKSKNGNIPVMRYCAFNCVYCAFQKFTKISPCEKCRAGENHAHMDVLQRTPPKTEAGEFLTVGLSGDVSFMPGEDFDKVLDYCRKWWDRTFLIQSKNPEYFLQFAHRIPDNVILGTTMETNYTQIWKPLTKPNTAQYIHYNEISKAPPPINRFYNMVKLSCRKAITCEPLLDFDIDAMGRSIKDIAPEFVYIGYDNHDHKLPEPAIAKTHALIGELRDTGIEVREKTIRPAWWESRHRTKVRCMV